MVMSVCIFVVHITKGIIFCHFLLLEEKIRQLTLIKLIELKISWFVICCLYLILRNLKTLNWLFKSIKVVFAIHDSMNQGFMQIKSRSKVRIEGTIENKSFSASWVGPKLVFEPSPDPKNSPLWLQKIKNDPKIQSSSNTE